MAEEYLVKTASMNPGDWAIVEAYAEKTAKELSIPKNSSYALRMIVREWANLTGFQVPGPQGEKNTELAVAA